MLNLTLFILLLLLGCFAVLGYAASSPKMELKYFNGAGRAEPIRILLHAAKADWKDTRFAGADWATIKPTTPLGSVPVLDIDGTDFTQSVALGRYAAKLAGFYPNDPLQALVVDEVQEVINELMSKAPSGGTDEERKEKRQTYQKEVMPKYFGLIESRIQQFGGGTTVCGTPSVADLQLMATVEGLQSGNWDYIDADFFEKGPYPGILACVEHTQALDVVKSYYASLEEEKKDEL